MRSCALPKKLDEIAAALARVQNEHANDARRALVQLLGARHRHPVVAFLNGAADLVALKLNTVEASEDAHRRLPKRRACSRTAASAYSAESCARPAGGIFKPLRSSTGCSAARKTCFQK